MIFGGILGLHGGSWGGIVGSWGGFGQLWGVLERSWRILGGLGAFLRRLGWIFGAVLGRFGASSDEIRGGVLLILIMSVMVDSDGDTLNEGIASNHHYRS